MRTPAHRLLSLVAMATFASSAALAQNAAPAAAEAPRPQDIDPAVNTSVAPAQETQRPEQIDPAVNTSATAPSTGEAAGPAQRNNPQPGAAAAQGQASRSTAKGRALDRLELDTTQITGNRELPKVLYIVPWKRSDLGDLVGRPVNSLLDEVLTPVDRDVFKRENRYYRALTPDSSQSGAGEATPNGGQASSPTSRAAPADSARPAAGSVGSATRPSTGSGSATPPAGDER